MQEKKNELIELLKDDVLKQLEELTFSNVSSVKDDIDRSFKYVLLSIDILNGLISDDDAIDDNVAEENLKELLETDENESVSPELLQQLKATVDSNSVQDDEGVFYETVDGGYIKREHGDNINVSESVRRKADISHGDKVALLPRYGISDYGFPYTIFKLDQKADIGESNLVIFDKAILERRGDNIEVNKNIDGEDLLDEFNRKWTFKVPYNPRYFQDDSLLAELVWVRGKSNSTANIRWRYDMGNYKNKELYNEKNLAYIKLITEGNTEEDQTTTNEEDLQDETPTNLLNAKKSLLIGISSKRKGAIKKFVKGQGSEVKSIIEGRRLIKEEFQKEIDDNEIDFIIIGEDLSKNGIATARKLAKENHIPFVQFDGTNKNELLNALISYSRNTDHY